MSHITRYSYLELHVLHDGWVDDIPNNNKFRYGGMLIQIYKNYNISINWREIKFVSWPLKKFHGFPALDLHYWKQWLKILIDGWILMFKVSKW